MTGREQAVGAALAVVVLIGIIDAAASHNNTSKSASVPTTQTPQATAPTTTAPTATPMTTTTARHHHPAAVPSAATSPVPTTPPTSSGAAPAPGRTTSTSPTATQVPPGVLGTFSYATTGYEETSFPGTHRDFPRTSTITNKREGCGVASTWKPIPEHVQKQVLCPAGNAIKVTAYQTTISFYGQSSGENFTCTGPSYVYKPDVKAGDTWKYTCKSADAVAKQTAHVIGYQTIDVGGTAVRTLHVHLATTLTGGASGTSAQDYWIATNKPVLVKEKGTVVANQGNVRYDERYSLALKSLSPKT